MGILSNSSPQKSTVVLLSSECCLPTKVDEKRRMKENNLEKDRPSRTKKECHPLKVGCSLTEESKMDEGQITVARAK